MNGSGGGDVEARRPIQVWRPEGDRWVRPAPGPFGDHHSARRVLEPRRDDGPPRVLLVGESVAAGYLLAPGHTPAGVLADLLPGHDVVDLARTDETQASLLETLEAAAQLAPDVVVVWAGNNWVQGDLARMSPGHVEATHRRPLGEALRDGGAAGAREWARTAVVGPLSAGLDRLEELAQRHRWRLVVVVPAVNEQGWPHIDPPMVGEARGAATVGATHGLLRGMALAPMATPPVQDLLRRWARRGGHGLVDVPALLGQGEEGFLDYCHHDVAGIERVMRAVAAVVHDGPLGRPAAPAGPVVATAAVGALLHTAHRLVYPPARRHLLARWRDEALRVDPSVQAALQDVVTTRLSRGPAVLTAAQRRNLAGPHRLGLMHGWRPQGLDADVLLALGAGQDPRLAGRMATQAGVEPWAPGARTWLDHRAAERGGGSTHLRVVAPIVAVPHLQDDTDRSRALTARLPAGGHVRLTLGRWSATVPVGPDWTTATVVVPASAAPPGLHPLRVHLPPHPDPAGALAEAVRALLADEPADLHPVLAELWALR